MSNKKPGYVLLYRSIWDNKIWQKKEPFDSRSAWIDLLLLANHEDREIFFDGKIITVKRGQHVTSYRELAERWRWEWRHAKRFLLLLQSDGMLTLDVSTHGITVTLINYGKYQDGCRTDGRTDRRNDSRNDAEAMVGTMQTNKELLKNDKRTSKKKRSPDGEKKSAGEHSETEPEADPTMPEGFREMTDEEQAAEMGVTLEQFRARFRRNDE